MIILHDSTDALKIKLGGAVTTNELPIIVCYDDIASTSRDEDRILSTTSGGSWVTICAGPSQPVTKNIDYINIYNKDTVAVSVTISFFDDATEYTMKVVSLAPGECLEYVDEQGWNIK